MNHQTLKCIIPSYILFELCDKIYAFKTKEYYTINKSSFKKAIFQDILRDFTENIKEYYHTNKYFYVDNVMTYSRFITLIRQICKCNNIYYTSQIKYEKSTYDIHYYIKIPTIVLNEP